jgi:dephospho-CoA kinase
VREARPFILGLTGSIGMGKTETAKLFAAEGIPVFDADAAIHDLYAGAAVEEIGREFPGTTRNGVVDRAALSAAVTDDPAALARLESLMHPRVAAMRDRFLQAHRDAPIVLFDIPLLLETGVAVDAVVVASAPAEVQRVRVMARPGMSEEKFAAILASQVADEEKRRQADFVIDTGDGLDAAREAVATIIAALTGKS